MQIYANFFFIESIRTILIPFVDHFRISVHMVSLPFVDHFGILLL